MTDKINQIINDRGQTHGSFRANAETAQTLKVVLRNNERFYALPPTQREALDMICTKHHGRLTVVTIIKTRGTTLPDTQHLSVMNSTSKPNQRVRALMT